MYFSLSQTNLSLSLPSSAIIQASHQLRFLREWAVFGRALRRSVWELLGVALALLLLVLAYSHTGHLVRFVFLSLPSVSLLPSHTHTHTSHEPTLTERGKGGNTSKHTTVL